MHCENIKNILGVEPLEIYPFGSRVYDCVSPESDYDYYVIISDTHQINYEEIYKSNMNIHVVSETYFQNMLNEHHIAALECWFLPEELKYSGMKFDFQLNKETLRRSLSKVCSNSFVKAKKKLFKENEIYIGRKSLFHSLRIAHYGIQIAKNGKIVEYHNEEIKKWYIDIMSMCIDNWENITEVYKPISNSLMSRFRELCPLT